MVFRQSMKHVASEIANPNRSGDERPAPPLFLLNTKSRSKEAFSPLKKDVVLLYSCGPTVYDYAHIGNLRSYVMADTLKRVLLWNGYAVRHVTNITDVGHLTGDNEGDADTGEDRMEKRARETGESARELANRYTEAFMTDIEALNIKKKNITWTRATDYIGQQIALAKTLEEKGYAYHTSDGIYFDTLKFPEYGALGGVDLKGIKEGARVAANAEKRHATDFALWKFSPRGVKREQEWESPWGVGFPGWHLECTAMIFAELGRSIDIHTGGEDHIPIHHNNEIAQAEAATGKPYVRYWLHNAFITIDGKRIGKSLKNTIRLDQVADRVGSALAYRYWLLTGHYRTPMNFTWEALEGAQAALTKLHRLFLEELGTKNGEPNESYLFRIKEAVNDDLDTPKAIAILWEIVKDENLTKPDKRATILAADLVLGLGFSEGKKKLKDMQKISVVAREELPEDIRILMEERSAARERGDFAAADQARDALREQGYTIEDTPEGPRVHKEKR